MTPTTATGRLTRLLRTQAAPEHSSTSAIKKPGRIPAGGGLRSHHHTPTAG